jgi:hypothetical protein
MAVGIAFSFFFMFVVVPLIVLAVYPGFRALWTMAALYGFGGAALGVFSQPYGPVPSILINAAVLAAVMMGVFGVFFLLLRWIRNQIARSVRNSMKGLRVLSVLGTIAFWLCLLGAGTTIWLTVTSRNLSEDLRLSLGAGVVFYSAIAIVLWTGMSRIGNRLNALRTAP